MPDPDDAAGIVALLNTAQVAGLLGVSKRTVEKWVQQRRIPFVKLGTAGKASLLRFRPDAIEAWIAAQEVEPGGD